MTMLLNPFRFGATAPATDPNFANVVLLCGFEGADGSTSFVDESPVARALNPTVNTQIDTAQKKFGASSALFDGISDMTALDSDDWTFPGQFTIECWIRVPAGLGNNSWAIVRHWGISGSRSWRLFFDTAATWTLTFHLSTSGTAATYTLSGNIAAFGDTWVHVAVDRDASNKLRLYYGGTMIASQTSATGSFNPTSGTLNIAGAATGQVIFNGWMDEIRITKGVARYASDSGYTVPAAAFPRS